MVPGKTTTSLNVAYAWAQKGYSVLLVDFDPQGSATKALGLSKDLLDDETNIKEMIEDELSNETTETTVVIDDLRTPAPHGEDTPNTGVWTLLDSISAGEFVSDEMIDDAIKHPEYSFIQNKVDEDGKLVRDGRKIIKEKVYMDFGFDILPSAEELAEYGLLLSTDAYKHTMPKAKGMQLSILIDRIQEYKHYDKIIIDLPPSLDLIGANGLMACVDGVFAVVNPVKTTLRGIERLKDNMRVIVNQRPEHLGIPGIIINRYADRKTLHRRYAAILTRIFKLPTLNTIVPELSARSEQAYDENLLLAQLDQKAYDVFNELADEIEVHVEEQRQMIHSQYL